MSTPTSTNRRSLLRGALATAGAAAAASIPAAAAAQKDDRALETDVLVVGLGFAGLIAALRAAQEGAKVLVIEKLPRGFWAPGGAFIISGQLVMQPPKPYPQFLTTFGLEEVTRAMEWFENLGIELGQAVNIEGISGGTVMPVKPLEAMGMWGMIKPGGKYDASDFGGTIAARLMEGMILDEGGEILYETKATSITRGEDGVVTGVTARDADGPFAITAKATILCTGGFGLNEEMVAKYTVSPAREVVNATLTSPGAKGDGLRMGLEIGAGASGFGMVYARISPAVAAQHPFHDLNGTRISSLRVGIAVDPQGRRMMDESLGTLHMGNVMLTELRQPFGWFIIDSAMAEEVADQVAELEALSEEYGVPLIYQANSLQELVDLTGIGSYFRGTVDTYNQAVANKRTAELDPPRTSPYQALSTPPFYAAPFVMGVNKSYGGLDVDVDGRVIDTEGEVIPGLFAAGEVAFGSRVKDVPWLETNRVNLAANGGSGNLDNCLLLGLHAAEAAVELADE